MPFEPLVALVVKVRGFLDSCGGFSQSGLTLDVESRCECADGESVHVLVVKNFGCCGHNRYTGDALVHNRHIKLVAAGFEDRIAYSSQGIVINKSVKGSALWL
ncbi:hypothetical protein [Nonomuraea wenchangensis]|uniref:hypothetical protein n=1 Tax=Nonomuraea wenchangensis TaxID=568860 RepID=UPI00340549F4